MWKNQFLKVMNSLSELEKDFIKMKDKDFLDREVKIKGELEELFFKAIIVSIDDMDKFEKKKKNEESKNTKPFKVNKKILKTLVMIG